MGFGGIILAALFCAFLSLAPAARAVETIETGMIGAANSAGWPWYIGIDKGYFAEDGIALDIIYVSTASGLVQQLAAGSLDIVADIGVVEPIHAVHRGAPVALLRIIGQVPPYEVVAKPEIKTVEDLKGKIVCIGGLLDINRVFLERIMQAHGLKNGDYDITVVGNTGARFAALKSGTIDATMLAPPVNFYAEKAGFNNIGMMIDYARDLPFAGTDIGRSYAEKHHDTVLKLMAVMDRAVAWFDDDNNRDEAVGILAKEMKTTNREDLVRSYDYLRKIDYFERDNIVSRSKLQHLIDAMVALGDIDGNVKVEQLIIPALTRIGD
jgi:NitT/TauT family transport system substrate-binding protein